MSQSQSFLNDLEDINIDKILKENASLESNGFYSEENYKKLEKYEPILNSSGSERFVVFPIQHHDLWKLYKKTEESFWVAEDIDYTKDISQWKTMNQDQKFFVKHILAFFANFDTIVNENLSLRFCSEIQIQEARFFYTYQMFIENIHSETYSLMIDHFAENDDEKKKMFNATENYPAVKKISDWAQKWIHSNAPLSNRIIAFACLEGIMFSSAFCAIFYFKKLGLLPGLCHANELISRDEFTHTVCAVIINSKLKFKAPSSIAVKIVKEAVELIKEFATESLPCSLLGMSNEDMKKYIEYVADDLLDMLNLPKTYGTSNPFHFMDMISASNKTNFFERRVSEYRRSNMQRNNQENQNNQQSTGGILDDF